MHAAQLDQCVAPASTMVLMRARLAGLQRGACVGLDSQLTQRCNVRALAMHGWSQRAAAAGKISALRGKLSRCRMCDIPCLSRDKQLSPIAMNAYAGTRAAL